MRPFNLAEAKIAERDHCRRYLDRRVRVIAALLGLAVAVAIGSYACRVSVADKASSVASELADVQGRCVQVKRQIAAYDASLSQRKWQQQLAGGSRRWLGILGSVLGCVPGDVWLGRLESSEASSSVAVDGRAASFESLSAFVDRLKRVPEFTEARLTNTRTADVDGAAFVDFSVAAKIKPTGPAAGAVQPPAPAQGVPQVQGSQ